MKTQEEATKIAGLRQELEEKRERIDARLELLDQYEELLEDAPPPPPPSKKVVRKKVATPPPPVPVQPPAPPKPPRTAKKRVMDQPPTKCGTGAKIVRDESSMGKIVAVIEDRSPHWMTHIGILEGAKGMGLNVSPSFDVIIQQQCAKLRKNRYKVPGLEWKATDRRMEYRIVKKAAGN